MVLPEMTGLCFDQCRVTVIFEYRPAAYVCSIRSQASSMSCRRLELLVGEIFKRTSFNGIFRDGERGTSAP